MLILKVLLLIAFFSVPFVCCFAGKERITRFSDIVPTVIFSTLIMSAAIIIPWLGYEYYLEYQVSKLDVNDDGIWSDEEEASWTDRERALMDAYFIDGARNVFAVFVFPICSLIYSLVIITGIYFVNRCRQG